MNDKIREYVNKEFQRDLANKLDLKRGINRIYVAFKINENGKVVGIQARGPHNRLEQEAERVVGGLPDMKPGRQGKQPVGVLYNLPIVLEVRD